MRKVKTSFVAEIPQCGVRAFLVIHLSDKITDVRSRFKVSLFRRIQLSQVFCTAIGNSGHPLKQDCEGINNVRQFYHEHWGFSGTC